MRAGFLAALAAATVLTSVTVDPAEAQSRRRARAAEPSYPPEASVPVGRGGFDRYAEPRGGGIITWNTPYPNGNFSNPGGGGGGGSGP